VRTKANEKEERMEKFCIENFTIQQKACIEIQKRSNNQSQISDEKIDQEYRVELRDSNRKTLKKMLGKHFKNSQIKKDQNEKRICVIPSSSLPSIKLSVFLGNRN
jgi:hypothetical protein